MDSKEEIIDDIFTRKCIENMQTYDHAMFKKDYPSLYRSILETAKSYGHKGDWHIFVEEDSKTYPPEGVEVLVSDGVHCDVAWYIMSGEYKWVKDDLENDDLLDFTSFVVKKWKYIE